MATAHLNSNLIRRVEGGSGAHSLAYMCGRNVTDVWSGQRYWYARRREREEVEAVGMGRFEGLHPSWDIDDAQTVAERIDYGEKRVDACIGRDFEASIPHELPPWRRRALAQDFADYLSARYRTAVPFAVHRPAGDGDERNFHVHTLVPDRHVGEDGVSMGKKIRQLTAFKSRSHELVEARLAWQHLANWHLQEAGSEERIYMGATRSADNPWIHLGRVETGKERRRQKAAGRLHDGRGVLAHVTEASTPAAKRAARQRPEPCPVPHQRLVRPDPTKLPIVIEEEVDEEVELPRPRAGRTRRPRTRLPRPADLTAVTEEVAEATEALAEATREAAAELGEAPSRRPRQRRRRARASEVPPPDVRAAADAVADATEDLADATREATPDRPPRPPRKRRRRPRGMPAAPTDIAAAEERVVEATNAVAESTREAIPEAPPRPPRKRRRRVRAVAVPSTDRASAEDAVDDAWRALYLTRLDQELQAKRREVNARDDEIDRVTPALRADPIHGDLAMRLWQEVERDLARREMERTEGKSEADCEQGRIEATAALIRQWAPGPMSPVQGVSTARLAAHRIVDISTLVERRLDTLEERHRPKGQTGRRRRTIGKPWPYLDQEERKRRRERKPKNWDELVAEKVVEIAADFLTLLFGLIALCEIAERRTRDRDKGRTTEAGERGRGHGGR